MKKVLSLMIVAALALPVLAEGEASKSEYLPVAGEFSVGFSANPLLNYIGGLFNGTVNKDYNYNNIGGDPLNEDFPHAHSFQPAVSIMGKYMLTDHLAVRANIGVIVWRHTDRNENRDDQALALDPLSEQKVIDVFRYAQNGGSLSAGVEYRIGKRRVQGVFSGSLLYAFDVEKSSYSYGNQISSVNQVPTISDATLWTSHSAAMPNMRPLKSTTEGTHTFGVVLGAGIECFIAPKISLGAEVNLSLLGAVQPRVSKTYEGYNVLNGQVEKHTDVTNSRDAYFAFGTQNVGANINFNFYF